MRKSQMIAVAFFAAVTCLSTSGRAAPPEQNIQTLMKLKLAHAQSVLEGLATEDFDKIEKNAQGLALVSQAAAWQVLQTPEYMRQSAEFRRTADDLSRHAKEKNLDAVSLDYIKLTMSCVSCHKHARSVRLSRADANLPARRLADYVPASRSGSGQLLSSTPRSPR